MRYQEDADMEEEVEKDVNEVEEEGEKMWKKRAGRERWRETAVFGAEVQNQYGWGPTRKRNLTHRDCAMINEEALRHVLELSEWVAFLHLPPAHNERCGAAVHEDKLGRGGRSHTGVYTHTCTSLPL